MFWIVVFGGFWSRFWKVCLWNLCCLLIRLYNRVSRKRMMWWRSWIFFWICCSFIRICVSGMRRVCCISISGCCISIVWWRGKWWVLLCRIVSWSLWSSWSFVLWSRRMWFRWWSCGIIFFYIVCIRRCSLFMFICFLFFIFFVFLLIFRFKGIRRWVRCGMIWGLSLVVFL